MISINKINQMVILLLTILLNSIASGAVTIGTLNVTVNTDGSNLNSIFSTTGRSSDIPWEIIGGFNDTPVLSVDSQTFVDDWAVSWNFASFSFANVQSGSINITNFGGSGLSGGVYVGDSITQTVNTAIQSSGAAAFADNGALWAFQPTPSGSIFLGNIIGTFSGTLTAIDLNVNYNLTIVPEPSIIALVIGVFVVVLVMLHRGKRNRFI